MIPWAMRRAFTKVSTNQMAIWMAIRRKSERIADQLSVRVSNLVLFTRRYVAKVLYTYILGYKVDVGHMEAVNLISSHKYSEKQIVSSRPR
jgi:hypothetical protein